MIEIINKPLLLHLVGYLYYWQMGFKSVFKGLILRFPGTLLRYCLSDFEMIPITPIITGTPFAFTFHMR